MVKRLRFTPLPDFPLPILKGVHVGNIHYYGAYLVSFSIIDSRGITRLVTQVFYCIERGPNAPDLLFSRPGMGLEHIILDTATEEWWFGETIILDPLEFAREVLDENQPAYIAYLTTCSPCYDGENDPPDQGDTVADAS